MIWKLIKIDFLASVLAVTILLGAAAPRAFGQQVQNQASTLKAYPCHSGDIQAISLALQRQFQAPNVQIAWDQRTRQILVQAPPNLQPLIAQRISQPNTTPAAPGYPRSTLEVRTTRPQSQQQSRSLPKEPAKSVSMDLFGATGQQIEAALRGILGKRIVAEPAGRGGGTAHRVSLPNGGLLRLAIDQNGRRVTLHGPSTAVDAASRLIRTLDSPKATGDQKTRLVSLQNARPRSVRQTIDAITRQTQPAGTRVAQLPANPAAGSPTRLPGVITPPLARNPNEGDLIGPVQVEMLDGLDVLVVRGHRSDVERVMRIVEQIERLSTTTEPVVEVHPLQYVHCQPMADLIRPLYDEIFLPRQGSVSITALIKPNALLLIGRRENVQTAIDLVKKLDRPVPPETEFRVFRLQHAAAANAQATITEFFGERGGLAPQVVVAIDARSNALIVYARPRDMAEVAKLVAQVDIATSAAVNELRVFQLENSLATDLAPILQQAITGQTAAGGAANQAAAARSAMLRFSTIDARGRRELKSGILSDVQITADARSNALMVSAPASSMELIAALIRQLDQLPAAEAQIKVFTIVNGDATELSTMLETLFAQTTGGSDQPAVRTGVQEGESSLVSLRFAVDMRTNSIIASGSMGDLQVVEAILLRLDESDVRHRRSAVYRLKNAPATDVATAINEFLRSERDVQQLNPEMMSPFEQIEREVVVVPEPVSNSLIVSATPRFFEEVSKLVEQLDERPPMVMIQVLIAEVGLNDTDEFGVELGLQDSILFDRSLLDQIQTISQTFTDAGGNQTTNQNIVSAINEPGFHFNGMPLPDLGNSGAGNATQGAGIIGSQGVANFSVGRQNSELGFGGLVLSASSESVSILIRALNATSRMEVLSRPQVMTLDNQPAFIQVGSRVPRVTGVQTNQTGQTSSTVLENVGLILGVTPRISPDGLVVMEIDAEKSHLGPIDQGIPIAYTEGHEIRSPIIETTTAQTTVSALSGQTIVLGGLISKSSSEFHRKVPCLGDMPFIGHLFRYDGTKVERRELLMIMTPHIVRTEAEAEALKQTEVSRLSWCLADVIELQGEGGLRGRQDEWSDSETRVIYPDLNPSVDMLIAPEGAMEGPETVPTPQGFPRSKSAIPMPPPDDSSQRLPQSQQGTAICKVTFGKPKPRNIRVPTTRSLSQHQQGYANAHTSAQSPPSHSAPLAHQGNPLAAPQYSSHTQPSLPQHAPASAHGAVQQVNYLPPTAGYTPPNRQSSAATLPHQSASYPHTSQQPPASHFQPQPGMPTYR